MYKYFQRTFHVVKICVIAILIVRTFLIEPGSVNGRSMENTFMDNQFFLVNKLALLFREPRRGDIVIVQEPNVEKIMIKRVIGLPGESITLTLQGVEIKDKQGHTTLLSEPYLQKEITTRPPPGKSNQYLTIPPHTYFIMGDNRPMSIDSRSFGAIERKDIYGVVMDTPFSRRKI